MSGTFPAKAPECLEAPSESIELVIAARARDLGGFEVRRVLPSSKRRLVGPFVFFDHIGPAEQPPGIGIDVRPHPHINLCTVTYLFRGELFHRDSLGSAQAIRAGDVNWMIAGRGIAHSERTSPEVRLSGGHLHGIQSWVALPKQLEETEPRFEHHSVASIPRLRQRGIELDVIAGTGFGATSPVSVLSPTFYVHAWLEQDALLEVDIEHAERAVYVVEGVVQCDGRTFGVGTMFVLRMDVVARISCKRAARLMLVGGAALDGERHVFWNFVSSSKERIEQAKDDWRSGRFGKVPGDEDEFIPLPPDA